MDIGYAGRRLAAHSINVPILHGVGIAVQNVVDAQSGTPASANGIVDRRTRILFITNGIEPGELAELVNLLDRVSERTANARLRAGIEKSRERRSF